MKKIILPGIIAGIAMLVLSMVVGMLTNLAFPSLMNEYENPALFRSWSDPIMNLYYLHPFLVGILLAWAWDKTKKLVKAKGPYGRGLHFGLAFFAISTIPGMLISYSSFPVSLAMIATWSISSLVQLIGAGIVYAKMNP